MSGRLRPPALAERLLRFCARGEDKQWIARDLEEEMHARAEASGALGARWWYRRQVASSIVPLLAERAATAARERKREEDPMWQQILADARYGLRVSVRTPLTTAAVIVTMILGIAATAAVFSVVDAVILRPLPFPASERTVQLFGVDNGNAITSLAYADLRDFERTSPAIEMLGIAHRSSATYVGPSEAQQLRLAEIDSMLPRVLSLRPAIGRLFTADEHGESAPPVVVLTHAFWMSEFGGDPSAVGRSIRIGATTRTIVGILPPMEFMFPTGPLDAITPLQITKGMETTRGIMWLEAIARLRRGATLDQAKREIAATARQIAAAHADEAGSRSATVKVLRAAIVSAGDGSVARMLLLLSLAVAAVLLTACINVGNLLLAHASTRSREFAVRAALGGSAWRVRRQVLTETLVLAVIGGSLGLMLAPLLTHALVALYPGDLPRAAEVNTNGTVIVVAIALTLLAAIVASLPALRRASRQPLANGFRSGVGAGISRSTRRVEGGFISAQMAATLALLFAAALIVRTLRSVTSIDPGFDPRGALAFTLLPSPARHPDNAAVARFYAELDRALRAIPGVTAVTTTSHVPFAPGSTSSWFIRDDVGDRGKDNPNTGITIAAQGFERALRLTLLEGRSFTTADDSTAPRVVLINDALAKRVFPGVDPIGRTIHYNKLQWRIIGVVAAAHDKSLIDPAPPMLYLHFAQQNSRWRWVIVRTSRADAGELLPSIRAALRSIDQTVPMSFVGTLDGRIAESVAAHRFRAWLVGSLGALAAVLALLGVFAIVSQAVTRRTREIGVRMALGQDAASVQREVVTSALRVAAIGGVLGIALSIAVGRSLSSFLYGVNSHDPVLLGSATLALLGCCALASFVPARRASRIDPVAALRAE